MALAEEVVGKKSSIPRIKISLGKKKDNAPLESTVKPPNTAGKSPTELKRKIRDDHQIKCRARAKISKLENEVKEIKKESKSMTLELEIELKERKKQWMLTKMEKGHFEDKISTLEKQVEELTKELKEVRKESKLVSIETDQASKVRLSLSC